MARAGGKGQCQVRISRSGSKGNVKWKQLGQVRMVRSCKNDNVKCDGLAMVARGISSDNG